MFSLDVVSHNAEEKTAEEKAEVGGGMLSIQLADRLDVSPTYKPTKQLMLDLLNRLHTHEIYFAKHATRFYRRGAKKVLVNPVACTHFCLYCEALRTADSQLFIDPSPTSKIALLFLANKFVEFFSRNMSKIGAKENFLWDQQLGKLNYTNVDAAVRLSIQAIDAQRIASIRTRVKAEKIARNQKQMRKVVEKDKAAILPELTWDPMEMKQLEYELLRSELLEMDDACLIIQCAERMRQAIERGFYLLDVRRKALDLHMDAGDGVDPEKAIVKIQAITRGHLARKRVKKMREAEARALGMDTEALLKERTAARHHSAVSLPPSPFTTTKNLALVDIPADFKWPKTMPALSDLLHNNFFIVDPFDELDKTGGERPSKQSKEEQSKANKAADKEVEAALNRLLSAEIAVLGYDDEKTRPLDEMITYTVEARVNGEVFFFDLRNLLYLLVVLPCILSPWPAIRVKRNNVLLIGGTGSGRHSWVKSASQKVGAVRIYLNKKTLAKRKRTKTVKDIKLFCSTDRYAFLVFEQLDFFNERHAAKGSPFKNFYRVFIKTLIEEQQLNVQVVGIANRPNLEPEILSLFNAFLTLRPPSGVDRYELIADDLSRRQEESKLSKIPQHLADLSRSTKSLSIGATVDVVGKRCSRKR